MDALTVWRVWRRILREPRLREEMFGGNIEAAASYLNLTASEVQVVREYASAELGTRFFVANYRFRMISSFFNALETAAPLTSRALAANSVDMDSLATEFLDVAEWRDFGPYVFTFGREILNYLATHPAVASIAGARDLVRLERAGVNVVIDAAAHCSATAVPSPDGWRARPWFEVVCCALNISPWLRDKKALGRTAPIPGPQRYVAFLPSLDEYRRIVSLPDRAADILPLLRSSQSEASLGKSLVDLGYPANPARDRRLLHQLSRLGLVVAPWNRD